MSRFALKSASQPTFYFVGVSTSKSSIRRVFPEWVRHLGLGGCALHGLDCKPHDERSVYREIVSFIKDDPLSLGGLVTTHKIDLLEAARDLFDGLGPYAERLAEVSCISKRDGLLWGHAVDPVTSGLSLRRIVSRDYWQQTGAELFLIGAGGSSLALTMHLMEQEEGRCWPVRVVVSNRSQGRLYRMREIHARHNPGLHFEYVHAPRPEDNDAVLASLAPGSIVINATGLGKDAPGSPLTDASVFPEKAIAWDFNYRGELVFLDQARAQAAERGLRVEDGWDYFIYGWTRVMAAVFHREIPSSGPEFDRLSQIAAAVR